MPRFQNDRSGSIINVDELTASKLGGGWSSLDDDLEPDLATGELEKELSAGSEGVVGELDSSLGDVAEEPEQAKTRRRSGTSSK